MSYESISTYVTSSPCITCLIHEFYVYCYRAKINIPEIPDTVTENSENLTTAQETQITEGYENSIVIENTASAKFRDEQPST